MSKFKIGDKVRCVTTDQDEIGDYYFWFTAGKTYEVRMLSGDGHAFVTDDVGDPMPARDDIFELVQPEAPVEDKALAWLKRRIVEDCENCSGDGVLEDMLQEVYGLRLEIKVSNAYSFVKDE